MAAKGGAMRSITHDPLLALARGVILVSMGVTALIGALFLVLSPFMVFGRFDIMARISGDGPDGLTTDTFIAIGGVLILIAAMAACAFLFLRHLLRIIDSVGQGDPFNPVNAGRLAAMGWLALAIEGISFPTGLVAAWIARTVKDSHIGIGFSLGGVLLAIILFILARIFRKGAEMRAELEGTV
ncbi:MULTISPECIES: DUF2975 domain-containing protein [unclassified Novosphingobium]|uniref:DUF2975 domain-containing protein n=1 Tax=unclassified Novosphingobium TaxID=2644732 RepID=UPI00135A4AFE|nr:MULTISPECIES: DUF2975 domain-containing protein [unclassified Novosphingobium]